MRFLIVLTLAQLSSNIVAFAEVTQCLEYSMLSVSLASGGLFLVWTIWESDYTEVLQRLALLIQASTVFPLNLPDQYLAFSATYQIVLHYSLRPEKIWCSRLMFLSTLTVMLVFTTGRETTLILRSTLWGVFALAAEFSQKPQSKLESTNLKAPATTWHQSVTANVSLQMPRMLSQRITKGQSSTYHKDSLNIERYELYYIILDDQLQTKRVSDKMQILMEQERIPTDGFLDSIVINKIDQLSKVKLGIKNRPQTLRSLLQHILQLKFSIQVLILDGLNFKNFIMRVQYNETDLEIYLIDSRERDLYLHRKYLYLIMKQIFSTISHEFGTGFNFILAIAQTDQGNERLKQIHNQSLIMHHFVLDMVDFNDILGKSFQLQLKELDVSNLLFSVQSLFSYAITQKGISFDIINEIADQQIQFTSDPRRIKQILIHLVQNAQKFTIQGYVRVYVQLQDNYLQFTVEDSGIGMAREEAERLRSVLMIDFKPVQQISENTAGFGLGCYLSNKLALHLSQLPYNAGGGLQFERLRTGTRFWFRVKNMPVAQQVNLSQHSSGIHLLGKHMYVDIRQSIFLRSMSLKKGSIRRTKSIMSRNGQLDRDSVRLEMSNQGLIQLMTIVSNDGVSDEHKPNDFSQQIRAHALIKHYSNEKPLPFLSCKCVPILIVDDEIISIMALQSLLRKMGYQSDSAFNGIEALKKLEENQRAHCPYAGVFMDINMPLMNGFQTTQEIMRRFSRRPRVVACTAFTDAETKIACYETGMEQVINKPVSMGELYQIIRFWNL